MDTGNGLSNSQSPELGTYLHVDETMYAKTICIIDFEVVLDISFLQEPLHKGLFLNS